MPKAERGSGASPKSIAQSLLTPCNFEGETKSHYSLPLMENLSLGVTYDGLKYVGINHSHDVYL